MADTKVHAIDVKGNIRNVILIMLEDLHFKGGGSEGGGEGESASTSNGRRYRTKQAGPLISLPSERRRPHAFAPQCNRFFRTTRTSCMPLTVGKKVQKKLRILG